MYKVSVNHIRPFLIASALLLILSSGCSTTVQSVDHGHVVKKKSRLLVIPFTDMAAIYGDGVTVRGPATQQVFVTGRVEAGANDRLGRNLNLLLAGQPGLNWIDTAAGANLFSSEQMTNRTLHNQAISRIGAAKGSDVVLAGYLYAFEERLGSNYGVERPAKVAFELVLIQADTGQLLWQSRHVERQAPLSSNLMAFGQFIERKGRWISAREMAQNAMEKMLPGMIKALPK